MRSIRDTLSWFHRGEPNRDTNGTLMAKSESEVKRANTRPADIAQFEPFGTHCRVFTEGNHSWTLMEHSWRKVRVKVKGANTRPWGYRAIRAIWDTLSCFHRGEPLMDTDGTLMAKSESESGKGR